MSETYLLAVPKHMKHTTATTHCERVMNSGASNCGGQCSVRVVVGGGHHQS